MRSLYQPLHSLNDRRRPVGHALDDPHRQRRSAEACGDEERQDREHHLVIGICSQVGDADAENISIEPGRPAQLISRGSE